MSSSSLVLVVVLSRSFFSVGQALFDLVVVMASSSVPQESDSDNPEVLNVNLVSKNQNSISLSNKALVGIIRATKIMNIKALKEIIFKAWNSYKGLHITKLGKNMFLFSFNHKAEAMEVLQKPLGSL